MQIIRHEVPFENSGYLSLLEKIFGKEEAELERIQVDGSENAWNRDVTFTAEENGRVYGTIHMTIPKDLPWIAGLSGLCTAAEIRGSGVGKQLFAAIVEEVDKNGVKAAFLGTNNPMASVMYEKFGFSYLPGTYTMARFSGTDRNRFFKEYGASPAEAKAKPMDPSFRIPVIPMLENEGPGFLLDSNTGIFSNRFVAQQSTMGLYPRYLDIVRKGGSVFQLVSSEGIIGGAATVKREADGTPCADFFCMTNYLEFAPELIRAVEEAVPGAAFHVCTADTGKCDILASMGYRKQGTENVLYSGFCVPCSRLIR